MVQHWVGGALDLPTMAAAELWLRRRHYRPGAADVLRHGATAIHGVDIRREYAKLPRIAREQLGMSRIPCGMTSEHHRLPQALLALVDGIMSWSTFEHVQRDQLAPIFSDLYACLRPVVISSSRSSRCSTRRLAHT